MSTKSLKVMAMAFVGALAVILLLSSSIQWVTGSNDAIISFFAFIVTGICLVIMAKL